MKNVQKKYLAAHILLDRSGSMMAVRDQTIGAINEYISGLVMKTDISARVSLTLFDSDGIDLVIDGVKANEAKLTDAMYMPRAMTPLNDAIGKTVARIDAETRREGENVALVIVTDGLENASVEYKKEAVKALIEDRQKSKNWLVIFLGANIDAFAEGVAARGTMARHTMQFDAGRIGSSMQAAARSTSNYAASGGDRMAAAFTDEDRAQAVEPKPKQKSK